MTDNHQGGTMSAYETPTLQQHHHIPEFSSNPNHLYPVTAQSIGLPNQLYSDNNGTGQTREHSSGAALNGADKTRLRKACDSCSKRKVKCDNEGPPCQPCATLDIPCTFDRPSRRRGPPNRHAENLKKQKLGSPGYSGHSAPSSPTHAAHALASFAQQQVLSAEAILPFSIIQLMVDDYFVYIHPLIPIPHEPTFRDSLAKREDLTNRKFLALLASMMGCLVASFPRRPLQHLKAYGKETLFPNSISLVDRCQKIAMEARGPGYLDGELTIHDAVTSYLQGVTGAYTFRWRQCRLYLGESLTIAKTIGLYKVTDQSQRRPSVLATMMNERGTDYEIGYGQGTDLITQQLARRLFWVVFVGVKSMQQLGVSLGQLIIAPQTPSEPYPPLPMELDDACIFQTYVVNQPTGTVSRLAGFNANVRVYSTYDKLDTMEVAYGIDEVFDWDRQRHVIECCLRDVKRALNDVPPELMLRSDNQFEPTSDEGHYHAPDKMDPEHSGYEPYPREDQGELRAARRNLQYEIQKANIYVSQLCTRSYIVEKYWNLLDNHNRYKSRGSDADSPGIFATGSDGQLTSANQFDVTEREMASEREDIFKELLTVLYSITQVNTEPNGASFINKIRQIASTLLDIPRRRKSALAIHAEQYLSTFLQILMKLEGVTSYHFNNANAASSGSIQEGEGVVGGVTNLVDEEDEDAQLRHWADLREFQAQFAQAGGFLSAGE